MIGVILLAHDQLRRTAQLARHLAAQGCRVVVHIDARVRGAEVDRFIRAMGESPNLALAPRRRCAWGTFSLVEASLGALRVMFERWPGVTHVVQLSGSCLPIKPIAMLEAHLAANPETDFIEAVDVEQDPWVIDGLSIERFTLYHPLAWRQHRWLFDRNVELQRRLGVHRKLPAGLSPRIGSQWWCLSRPTLDAILSDPQLDTYKRYFRSTWIPDESFFQTLAAKHSDRISGVPLTFARFDPQGKPYMFYDDHLELLLQAEGFFARKIWRGAQRLYEVFLDPELDTLMPAESDGGLLLRRFERAQELHKRGRPGLISQGRHPGRQMLRQHETARAYLVIDGLQKLFPGLCQEIGKIDGVVAHGELFHPDRVEFAGDAPVFTGNLSASVAIRDHKPVHFLSKLIWIERDRIQVFVHDFTRGGTITRFLLGDANAHVLRLEHGWLFDLYEDWLRDPSSLQQAMAERMAAERRRVLRDGAADVHAAIVTIGLGEILRGGIAVQRRVAEALPESLRAAAVFPGPALPERFAEFLEELRPHAPTLGWLSDLSGQVSQYQGLTRLLRRKT